MTDDPLIDAEAVALAFGGWTVTRLRVWRHRHPGILEPAGRGQRGIALFRLSDVRHAQAVILEHATNST